MTGAGLADVFVGVACKRLTTVEVEPSRSNQHEIQGVGALRALLGTPAEKVQYRARFVWIASEDAAEYSSGHVTWSDVRRENPDRSAEYHLYYSGDFIPQHARPGDFFALALLRDNSVVVVISPAESTGAGKARWLFGLEESADLQCRLFGDGLDSDLDAIRMEFLDDLGIEVTPKDEEFQGSLLDHFGADFPPSAVFSEFARSTLPSVSAAADPDEVLVRWMDREELLFRIHERTIVARQLPELGIDVDAFVRLSLSVLNRRKSRAGLAFENHIAAVLKDCGIPFERQAETEPGSRPDFLIPGQVAYRDPGFPSDRLFVLGAKRTCKDRWRQVLAEADRVERKHLITLEPGITGSQLSQMSERSLTLLAPASLHETYPADLVARVLSVRDFVGIVRLAVAGVAG